MRTHPCTSLTKIVQPLIAKHNRLVRAADRRDKHHQLCFEALLLETVDLQAHIYDPDPELIDHPDVQALRRKHFGKSKKSYAAWLTVFGQDH